jgi:hypothetical protein
MQTNPSDAMVDLTAAQDTENIVTQTPIPHPVGMSRLVERRNQRFFPHPEGTRPKHSEKTYQYSYTRGFAALGNGRGYAKSIRRNDILYERYPLIWERNPKNERRG